MERWCHGRHPAAQSAGQAHGRVAQPVAAGLDAPGEAPGKARQRVAGEREVVPVPAAREVPLQVLRLAGCHRGGPGPVAAVGIGLHLQRRTGGALVHEREIGIAVGDVIAHAHLRVGHGPAQRGQVAGEAAVETVGAQHPEIVGAAVGARAPAVVELLARLDRVAARGAVQVQAVIDMEHGRRGAGVGEQQLHRAAGCIGARARVQFIGQGAGRPRAGVLPRQGLRRGHGDLRQGPLGGAQRIGIDLAAPARQRGQGRIVGRGEVEGAGEITEDGAAVGADLRLLHAEAGFQEAQHRGVVEVLRVHPAAAAPG